MTISYIFLEYHQTNNFSSEYFNKLFQVSCKKLQSYLWMFLCRKYIFKTCLSNKINRYFYTCSNTLKEDWWIWEFTQGLIIIVKRHKFLHVKKFQRRRIDILFRTFKTYNYGSKRIAYNSIKLEFLFSLISRYQA